MKAPFLLMHPRDLPLLELKASWAAPLTLTCFPRGQMVLTPLHTQEAPLKARKGQTANGGEERERDPEERHSENPPGGTKKGLGKGGFSVYEKPEEWQFCRKALDKVASGDTAHPCGYRTPQVPFTSHFAQFPNRCVPQGLEMSPCQH